MTDTALQAYQDLADTARNISAQLTALHNTINQVKQNHPTPNDAYLFTKAQHDIQLHADQLNYFTHDLNKTINRGGDK